ncbi:DUF2147 domain-containing protein [Boseaceae bacterium BT-24-1]|nr:DUF2147 domain-containing protein [Boseaceae bacterium BT-24-1]
MVNSAQLTLTYSLSAIFTAWFLLSDVSATWATPKTDPFGTWLTQDGEAKVHLSRCGTRLCGAVVWLKQPIDSATGRLRADVKNPDSSLKERSVVGLQFLIDMRPSALNAWSGRIYNADDGKSYTGTITQLDATRLEVRGCAGLLCETQIWTQTTR